MCNDLWHGDHCPSCGQVDEYEEEETFWWMLVWLGAIFVAGILIGGMFL